MRRTSGSTGSEPRSRSVPRDRRPGAQVTRARGERHVRLHAERGQLELLERKVDRSIPRVDQRALGRPVRADLMRVERADDVVDGAVDRLEAVAPDGDHASRCQDAPDFDEEAWHVEPVQRLADRHEAHRRRREPALLRARNTIRHTLVRRGRGDLLGARVGRDDRAKEPGEARRGLATAGRAVPRGLPRGCEA